MKELDVNVTGKAIPEMDDALRSQMADYLIHALGIKDLGIAAVQFEALGKWFKHIDDEGGWEAVHMESITTENLGGMKVAVVVEEKGTDEIQELMGLLSAMFRQVNTHAH